MVRTIFVCAFFTCAMIYLFIRKRREGRKDTLPDTLALMPYIDDLYYLLSKYKSLYIKCELLGKGYPGSSVKLMWEFDKKDGIDLSRNPELARRFLETLLDETEDRILYTIPYIVKWYLDNVSEKPDLPIESYSPLFPVEPEKITPDTKGKYWYFAYRHKGEQDFTVECYPDAETLFQRKTQIIFYDKAIKDITDAVHDTYGGFIRKLEMGELL